MRILNITNIIPHPPLTGAPLRTYNLLRRLAKDHDIYIAGFSDSGVQKEEAARLFEFCRGSLVVEGQPKKASHLFWNLMKWPSRRGPLELRLSFSDELAKGIRRLIAEVDFDIIQIEHGNMGLYLEAFPAHLRKRVAWILHDIDFDKFKRIAQIERRVDRKLRSWTYATTMKWWQPRFAQKFGLCLTMSEIDKRLLVTRNTRLRVEVSPSGVDTDLYQPLPEESETPAILFIGHMGYPPNIDAVRYFHKDILPLIRQRVADAEFWIVGLNPGEAIKKLAGDGVFVRGNVSNVEPYYRRSRVCVVPLRAGSGVRMKILEAMALGRPVVSTSLGAEGLDVVEGKHIVIADDSIGFAERTVDLLSDQTLRTRMTREAREHVVASYDWDVLATKLLLLFQKMVH
jgi:sugar transferase (PEP-CTERM/EpsH1 system associated)